MKTYNTKHTAACKMSFGKARPETGCPRCIELANGAAPVKWARSRRDIDAENLREIDAHFASEKHQTGKCGPVCTFGEW
jgi:hypothetical protein